MQPHSIIATGSVGKIVYPPLNVDVDRKKPAVVSKIAEKTEVVDEFDIGQKIIDLIETDGTSILIDGTRFRCYRFGVYGLTMQPLLSHSTVRTRLQKRKWNAIVERSPGLSDIDPSSYIMQMEKADGDVHFLLDRCTPKALFSALLALRNTIIGLTKMHAAGFYHFDVKPSNILFFGPLRNPSTTKMADFGLAKCVDDADLWDAAALTIPWQNFPPWASYIALFFCGGSREQLSVKENEIRLFFERPDCERFTCVDERIYTHMQIDLGQFVFERNALFDAIDIYGLAMCLDRVYYLAPAIVQSRIRHFCTDAAMCELRDNEVLSRWDEILYAF